MLLLFSLLFVGQQIEVVQGAIQPSVLLTTPDDNICAPIAVIGVARFLGIKVSPEKIFADLPATNGSNSMKEIAAAVASAGMHSRAIEWHGTGAPPISVPAIMPISRNGTGTVDHFIALLGRAGPYVYIFDPPDASHWVEFEKLASRSNGLLLCVGKSEADLLSTPVGSATIAGFSVSTMLGLSLTIIGTAGLLVAVGSNSASSTVSKWRATKITIGLLAICTSVAFLVYTAQNTHAESEPPTGFVNPLVASGRQTPWSPASLPGGGLSSELNSEIELRNVGRSNAKIVSVSLGCTCLQLKNRLDAIPAGGTTILQLSAEKSRTGPGQSSVQLTFEDGAIPAVLSVSVATP